MLYTDYALSTTFCLTILFLEVNKYMLKADSDKEQKKKKRKKGYPQYEFKMSAKSKTMPSTNHSMILWPWTDGSEFRPFYHHHFYFITVFTGTMELAHHDEIFLQWRRSDSLWIILSALTTIFSHFFLKSKATQINGM